MTETRKIMDRCIALNERAASPAVGHSSLHAVADEYNAHHGRGPVDTKVVGVDSRRDHIARAYDRMRHQPNHPKVQSSYNALKGDVKSQWDHLSKHGYTMSVHKDDPYKDHAEMLHDIHTNKHIKVWEHNGDMPKDHPLNNHDGETGHHFNHLFRAVHDVFGHGISNHDFSEKGEENAWRHHAQMFSKEALPALTTETKGQSSVYGNRHDQGKKKLFPKQKAGILPVKFHSRIDESLASSWWDEFELPELEEHKETTMSGSREFVKKMSDLLILTEKKLVRKEGSITETLHLGGDSHQLSHDTASRTGLGRLALAMQPPFSTDAGGHNGRESNGNDRHGEIPQHGHNPGTKSEGDENSGKTVTEEPEQDQGETSMGTQDPMGKDEPVHGQPRTSDGRYSYKKQDGMVVPPDRKGEYNDNFFKTATNEEIVKAFRESVLADMKDSLGEEATQRDLLFACVREGFSMEEAYEFVFESEDNFSWANDVVTDQDRADMIEAIKRRIVRVGSVSARAKQFREGEETTEGSQERYVKRNPRVRLTKATEKLHKKTDHKPME